MIKYFILSTDMQMQIHSNTFYDVACTIENDWRTVIVPAERSLECSFSSY